jgi:hypothetical protein
MAHGLLAAFQVESMHRPRVRRADVKLAVGIVDAHQIPFLDPEHPRQPFWNDDLEKISLYLGDPS